MSVRHAFLPLIAPLAFLMGQSLHGEALAGDVKPPAASQPVRTDHYGDPLPKGVRFRLGTVRLRHDMGVIAIAWLPDGHTLASAGWDDTVRLWQIPGGKQLAKWDKMDLAVFSPDRRTLAYGGSKGPIRICDLATGKELRRVNVPKAGVYPYAFSPDGKTLAAIQIEGERGVRLYAVDSGKEVRSLKEEVPWGALAFSRDGQTLAGWTENGGLCCWQTATGKKLKTLESNVACSPAFSPDGKLLAAAVADGASVTYPLWSWPAGKELRRLDPKDNSLSVALAFSPDSKILATGGPDSVRLWDVTTGTELRRFEGHNTYVSDLAFSPDGSLLASAGTDGVMTVWEVDARKAPRPLTGVGHRLAAVAVTGDGRTLLTHAGDGALTLWDGRDGRRLRTPAHCSESAMTLLVSPDGSRALVQSWLGDSPLWWDLASGRRLPAFSGIPLGVGCAAFAPNSALLGLGGRDGIVYLRDTEKGGEVRQLKEDKEEAVVCELAFSPDGRMLAASHTDGNLILWDLNTGQPRHHVSGPRLKHTWKLAFSSDSRLLAVVWEHAHVIHLFETISGQEIRQLRIEPVAIGSLAFAPGSRILAVGDAEPDDDGISESAIRLWDLPTGKPIHVLRGHRGDVRTLAFSPDGASLFSGSNDCTVLCWDVAALMRRRPAGKELSADKLADLWTELASKDAARAQRAVADLIQAPDSALPYLQKALPPVPPVKMAPIAAWIADLDHEEYARRQRASKELGRIGETAAPALRRVLNEKPSLETRKRITALLEAIDAQTASPEWLRTVRSLQVLESIGTPEARRILDGLASGASEAGLTQEAKASLKRLARRSAKP